MLTKYTNRRLLFWDALIGSVGGLFGNIANVQAQQDINAQNIAFAKEMYAQQRSDALADREHLEQYNDPSSQMQRLANAGLNPNLVYGNGTAVNTVNALPHQATANMPNLTAPRLNPDMLNIAQVLADIDLTKSQADANRSAAKQSDAAAANLAEQTYGQGLQNKWLDETFESRVDEITYQVENLVHDANLKAMRRGWLPDMQRKEFDKLNQEVENLIKSYALMAVEENWKQADIANKYKELEVKDAMIKELQARTDLSYSEAEEVYHRTLGYAVDNELKVFGALMDAAKNPVVAASLGMDINNGDIYGWAKAMQRAQSVAKYGHPDSRKVKPVRRRK